MIKIFSDFQAWANQGWTKKRDPIDPRYQRKMHLCPKCGKDGYRVKMDYKGNKHVQMITTKYDVSFYNCPRCRFEDKEFMRIEGRGTNTTNMGKMFGGE